MLFPFPFVTDKDIEYLRKYRYRGEDRGLLNRFVLGGVYDKIVGVLPVWLAPNLVTLSGPVPAVLTCIAFSILWGEVNSTSLRIGLNLAAAVSVWWFLIADNCDGKLARKIPCCSPLGDWLDHSLDILSYTAMMLSACWSFGAGPWLTFTMVAMTVATYQVVCWEAFLTGEVIINEVEACSEGVFAISLAHLAAATVDPALWARKPIPLPWSQSIRAIDILVVFSLVVCAMSAISVSKVLRKIKTEKGLSASLSAVAALAPAIITIGSSLTFGIVFPEAVAAHPWAWHVQLASSTVFFILVTNLVRLLGFGLGWRDVIGRPFHIIAGSLPWVVTAAIGDAASGVEISSIVNTAVLGMWWMATTQGLNKNLGTSLVFVKKAKQP